MTSSWYQYDKGTICFIEKYDAILKVILKNLKKNLKKKKQTNKQTKYQFNTTKYIDFDALW